ncbi:MAG TPA: DUF2442 domain-containing protein [Pyrinomonadaceae bacterium]
MSEMIRPVLVKARSGYRIYLEFSDGSKGEVDLSDLAGNGVFQVWSDYNFFEKVHLGDHREIKWNDEIELCADSLYLKLTGKSPQELFPKLREKTYA